jgi:cytochrome b561
VIGRIAILLLACALVRLCWRLVQRARASRKQRLHRLEIELRLADAFEGFHQEVFRLKHYGVLRPNASGRNAGLIPSTNVSSLRYIKGRQNED